MAGFRSLLPAGTLALVAALGSGLAGFVYAHEPSRDQVVLTVDHSRPTGRPTVVTGTVTRASDGRLVVEADGGPVDLALTPSTTVEELEALPPAALTPGVRVNIGAERSDYGIALTGVVVVAGP